MKPYFYCLSALFFLLGSAMPPTAGAAQKPGVVYVIPIKDMIERGLVYVVRRGMNEAVEAGASTVILDIDTPGGRVDSAEEIIDIIANTRIKTCTYVNPRATSAGAIISFSTDEIYMAPGSTIGDAMPLMMSPIGSPQEMPSDLNEKMVSYVSGIIRSTAQRKHHDPKLAEAMVRRGPEYKIDDIVVCPSNQILTLTNVEAERQVGKDGEQRSILSKGTVQNFDDLLLKLGHEKSRVVRIEVTDAEKIARYIEMFSYLFLMGGLLGLYIEFKTPGVILPGIIGVLLLVIWFWGHHIAGLAGMGEIVLFLLGLALLASEVFIFPGTALPGIIGTCLIMLSLIMAMAGHYPGMPWQPNFKRVPDAISGMSLSLVGTFVLAWILARFLPETTMYRKIVLSASESRADGFQASAENTTELVGQEGVAVSELRPSGVAQIGERRLDVITRGDFIEKDTRIIIAEAHGNRIVVQRKE